MGVAGTRLLDVRDPEISPAPTSEEAAAIVAAIEILWPKPVAAVDGGRDRAMAWRFSGRWWQRDRFARADRPWS